MKLVLLIMVAAMVMVFTVAVIESRAIFSEPETASTVE